MRAIAAALLTLACCLPLPAPLLPGPNLAKRIESAQIIVVARLISGTTLASGPRVSSDFVLHVDRVLKGEVTPGSEIGAHLEGRGFFMTPGASQSAITEQLYGIWFLNQEAGSYSVVSRDGSYGELYAALAALPAGATPGKPGSTPAASVRNELVAALRSVAASLTGTPDERRLNPVTAQFRSLSEDLATLDPSSTLPVWREFAADSSVPLRALGLRNLIAANDPDGLTQAAAGWDTLAAGADISPIIGSLMSFSNGSDAPAVRALGKLATRERPEPMLRENASYALRAIHTREAMPALFALLSTTEERVRINALSGICLFIRNAPTVTPQAVVSMSWMQSRQPAPLLNDETQSNCLLGGTPGNTADLQRYVDFWNAWWLRHRTEIEPN